MRLACLLCRSGRSWTVHNSLFRNLRSAASTDAEPSPSSPDLDCRSAVKGQIYEDGQHPIEHDAIPTVGWSLVWRLKRHGHEAFFVGGTVRDLCLKQKPKDIDVVTSAELHEVNKLFDKSVIIGQRFPICLVMFGGQKIEVSSFSTMLGKWTLPPDLDKSVHSNKAAPRIVDAQQQGKLPITWSMLRRLEASSRDFSVNALMYEPCAQLLFDYVGGYQDLRDKKLRCLKQPALCFQEDPVRMLRAIRFAARLGLTIDDETAAAIRENLHLLGSIPQSRAQHELYTILAYGPLTRAFEVMWQYHLLDWILPRHAEYLTAKGVPRGGDPSDFLFKVLQVADEAHSEHWVKDEATCVAVITAPLVAHDICRLRVRLHKQTDVDEDSQREIETLRRHREDVLFALIAKNVLNKLPQTQGDYMIFTRAALRKAADILISLKKKHIRESHESIQPRFVKASEQMAFRILESKELEWKERSNLGLTMVDPEERSLEGS